MPTAQFRERMMQTFYPGCSGSDAIIRQAPAGGSLVPWRFTGRSSSAECATSNLPGSGMLRLLQFPSAGFYSPISSLCLDGPTWGESFLGHSDVRVASRSYQDRVILPFSPLGAVHLARVRDELRTGGCLMVLSGRGRSIGSCSYRIRL